MKKQHLGFELIIYDDENELPAFEKRLLDKAIKARKSAYAPYSNFQVGAAVLMENGEVVIGNNQENASYPSGLCAERVAVFQAGALYPGVGMLAIAVSAASNNHLVDVPAGPCGNCRQAIFEYEVKQKSPISVLLQGEKGPVFKCGSISDILPLAFGNSFLGDS
ncbi:MAG: cytidine deaminase [Bacteroidota bacterium]|nr:cytidine deaminase [uncultured Allomuricauda sp.]